MSITFKAEKLAECIAEGANLLERQWGELAKHRDRIKLNYDLAAYARAEERGQLLICTARDDGRLVGYAVYFLAPHGHIHYVGTPWAESDIYWVEPEMRERGVGSALFRFVEQTLAGLGVTVMQTRTKDGHPAAEEMLFGMGHERTEAVWTKVLR